MTRETFEQTFLRVVKTFPKLYESTNEGEWEWLATRFKNELLLWQEPAGARYKQAPWYRIDAEPWRYTSPDGAQQVQEMFNIHKEERAPGDLEYSLEMELLYPPLFDDLSDHPKGVSSEVYKPLGPAGPEDQKIYDSIAKNYHAGRS